MTIAEALQFTRGHLAGVSDVPDLEAEWLLLAVLEGKDSGWLRVHGEEELSPLAAARLQEMTVERATGKPLAYVLGEWEFFGRRFAVDERVLVPRPETEALVERAMTWLEHQQKPATVVDIGTGSGIVAITLVLEMHARGLPMTMIATDVSPEALEVARENARRHGVEEEIEFLEGDMLSPLAGRDIDLIVSNPPYVPTAEVEAAGKTLETKGLLFEPRIALDGGVDGQDYIKKITASGVPAVIEGLNGKVIQTNF